MSKNNAQKNPNIDKKLYKEDSFYIVMSKDDVIKAVKLTTSRVVLYKEIVKLVGFLNSKTVKTLNLLRQI